jgi:hypothetical protein
MAIPNPVVYLRCNPFRWCVSFYKRSSKWLSNLHNLWDRCLGSYDGGRYCMHRSSAPTD